MPPYNLNAIAQLEKNELVSANPWVWLYEVEVPSDPPTRYRLCAASQQIEFRGNLYYPFPIQHGAMAQGDAGNQISLSLTISNVSREISYILDANAGLINQPCRVLLVNKADISSNQATIEQDYFIQTSRVTEEAVSLQLGVRNLYDSNFPAQRLLRNYCRHQYRGAACGYAVSPTSPYFLSGCDKSFDGTNGCQAHGTSEEQAGVPVVHPKRFGGFRGIPVQSTRGLL